VRAADGSAARASDASTKKEVVRARYRWLSALRQLFLRSLRSRDTNLLQEAQARADLALGRLGGGVRHRVVPGGRLHDALHGVVEKPLQIGVERALGRRRLDRHELDVLRRQAHDGHLVVASRHAHVLGAPQDDVGEVLHRRDALGRLDLEVRLRASEASTKES
jgi:hypothetical protein